MQLDQGFCYCYWEGYLQQMSCFGYFVGCCEFVCFFYFYVFIWCLFLIFGVFFDVGFFQVLFWLCYREVGVGFFEMLSWVVNCVFIKLDQVWGLAEGSVGGSFLGVQGGFG